MTKKVLVFIETNKPIEIGDEVNVINYGPAKVKSWKAPTKPGSSGTVTIVQGTNEPREVYPGTFNAKFILESELMQATEEIVTIEVTIETVTKQHTILRSSISVNEWSVNFVDISGRTHGYNKRFIQHFSIKPDEKE